MDKPKKKKTAKMAYRTSQVMNNNFIPDVEAVAYNECYDEMQKWFEWLIDDMEKETKEDQEWSSEDAKYGYIVALQELKKKLKSNNQEEVE